MRITIKATGFDLTPSLKTYLETKIGGLEKLVGRFEEEGECEVWLEVARTTRHHHKGQVYMAEADMRLPGSVLRAVENALDVRAAIDGLKDKLRLEIDKYRTKKLSLPRRRVKKTA